MVSALGGPGPQPAPPWLRPCPPGGEQGKASKEGEPQGPFGVMWVVQLSRTAKGKGVAVLVREPTVPSVRGVGQSLLIVNEGVEEGWSVPGEVSSSGGQVRNAGDLLSLSSPWSGGGEVVFGDFGQSPFHGKSVVVSWEGDHELQCLYLLNLLQGRWKGIPFDQMWRSGRNKFFIRLPSWAAREFILSERKISVEDMGVRGFQKRVLLRGLPMVWRTEGVLRKVIEPFDFLLNYVKIWSEKILPPAMVSVWVLKDAWPPLSLLVVLGGLEVQVQVEVLPTPRVSSYADMVRCDHKVDAHRLPRDGRPVEGGARASEGLSEGT
ncbi:hypothetical protein QJS10_CPA16g00669 [Acorus calamus]|uniref:DUF4283 domain-containing protein n=1 Tax=Acorus calamus TaxID=4465 RepID=A0AAV9D2F3_ACOCL|nr:hypothetical protein QJS10_CPA16g00669 [Acorus calamus]